MYVANINQNLIILFRTFFEVIFIFVLLDTVMSSSNSTFFFDQFYLIFYLQTSLKND